MKLLSEVNGTRLVNSLAFTLDVKLRKNECAGGDAHLSLAPMRTELEGSVACRPNAVKANQLTDGSERERLAPGGWAPAGEV
jgi:hypothetical protein